jgi:cytochrome P450
MPAPPTKPSRSRANGSPPVIRSRPLVGAANRDPQVFEEPDCFLVDRQPNPHLSFAPGLHQCLGLQLARLEVRAVLRAWLQRYERIEVDEASSRRLVADRFRGFERLIVRFS